MIESLAPANLAEPWDNVGLMVGSGAARVSKVALALDPTLETIQAAHDCGAQLLLTHHPLIFYPLKKIDLDEPSSAAAALALKLKITIYSAHTNLDAAPDGVSRALARRLGLEGVKTLAPTAAPDHFKLVVFVPLGYEKEVQEAVFAAGAGRIGAYTGCSFSARGEGTFRPSEEARPFLGEAGQTERVSESRLEVLVENRDLDQVVAAMVKAHPYEEVAYDLYPLASCPGSAGIGCIGNLKNSVNINDLLILIKEKLEVKNLRLAARSDALIRVVAVVGGSGGNYLAPAKTQGAQVLISGDFGYHQAREAEALGLTLIDAGHFATERPILSDLADRLTRQAREEGLEVEFEIIAREQDPWFMVEE
ncbi:MAG: Nif3-like dinuclear metal center hexameric protein [Deltaproteobacteria bacterium]|nr:Nif3-like dinuclear metal center hexameric protein [Deltaproteobacteria bacterium]MBW2085830.1 Nif3-like dinuclear metal center hexameric protein [Deltaproteobacteria bacterium]